MPRHAPPVVERAAARRRAGCRPTSRRRRRPARGEGGVGVVGRQLAGERVSRVPRANASTCPGGGRRRRRGRSGPAPGRRAPSTRTRRAAARAGGAASSGAGVAPAARLAAGAQRRGGPCGAGRGAPRSGGDGPAPAAAAQRRRAQPQVGHQPVGLGAARRACRRRSPCGAAPRPGSSAPCARRRPSALVVGRPVVGAVVAVVGVERDLDGRRGTARTSAGAGAAEERGEGPVVGGDVLGPAHERRPAGPVDAASAPVGPTAASASAKATVGPDGHVEPARPAAPGRSATAGSVERRPPASATAGSGTAGHRLRARASSRPWSRTRCCVLAVLQDRAERGVDRRLRRARRARARRAPGPSRSSRRRPAACRARASRISATAARHLAGQRARRTSGARSRDDGDLALEVGVLDPVVEAAALEGVVHVAGAVRGEDHDRRHVGPERCRARGW